MSPADQPEALVHSLLEIAATVERQLDTALSNLVGISFTEYRLLGALAAAHQSTATRVALAAVVALTPSAVTRALKPLEKLGYVTSQKSDRDARQSLATLTRAGQKLHRNAAGIVGDVANQLPLGSLSVAVLQQVQDELQIAIRPHGGSNRSSS